MSDIQTPPEGNTIECDHKTEQQMLQILQAIQKDIATIAQTLVNANDPFMHRPYWDTIYHACYRRSSRRRFRRIYPPASPAISRANSAVYHRNNTALRRNMRGSVSRHPYLP